MSNINSLHIEKEPENEDDSGSWIMTFADMVSLLFAFFVILYTMSKVDQEKYQSMAASLKETFTGQKTVSASIQIINPATLKDKNLDAASQLNSELNTILEDVNSFIYQEKLQSKITAFIDNRGVVIKIADDVFFDTGSAEISERSKSVLNKLTILVKNSPFPLKVEGHTDNTPINTQKYPTNWELSTSRACNVVRFFIASGLSAPLFSVEGFGEYRPIAANLTESGKAKNRRVELIFQKEKILEEIKKNGSK